MAEGAQEASDAAAVVVPKSSVVVGGRRTRKQAQAVRAWEDAEKLLRKELKSKAHKGASGGLRCPPSWHCRCRRPRS